MKCNVTLKFSIIEQVKVSTPREINGKNALEKATEKIKKKYKGKEVNIIDYDWKYETLI